MVANPQDLIRGRQMGPADGAAMARGVREYRRGTLGQSQRDEQFSTDNQ
jgi:type IV pilus biogenesis protein CpaD/CtpE